MQGSNLEYSNQSYWRLNMAATVKFGGFILVISDLLESLKYASYCSLFFKFKHNYPDTKI